MSILGELVGLSPGGFLLVLIITLCVYLVMRNKQDGTYTLPPGPTPWPLVGNLPELYKNKKFFYLFMDYKKKYGDLFTIYLGFQPVVVVASLEKLREAMLQKQNEFAGRVPTLTGDIFSAGGKDIVFGQFDDAWKQQRKIAHTAMRKYATGKHLEDLVSDSFLRLTTSLDVKADSGEAFDPFNSLSLLIYNIIAAMTFGKVYDLEDPFFNTMIKMNEEATETTGDGLLGDIWPSLSFIPTPGATATRTFINTFLGYLDETIKEHKDNYDPGNVTDLTYHLLDVMKKTEEDEGKEALAGLQPEHFRGIISDIFFAGTDTSRFTLSWALLYLVNYPDIQKRAQSEIDAIIDEGDVVKTSHKGQLAYTDAVLHEVTRIRTLLPFALPHMTTVDTTLGDYKLKKGTQVWPFTYALHTDPNHWEEPEKFKPERFLDSDGKFASRNSAWLPFSTGRRVCVGESVAKVELLLSLTYLLKRYNFKPPAGKQTIEPVMKDFGTFVIPAPYDLVIERRT